MTPIKIGAALTVADRPENWKKLAADPGNLEVPNFLRPEVMPGEWRISVAEARRHLYGIEGQLGIHGPFCDRPQHIRNSELVPIIACRFVAAAGDGLGATLVVVVSPYNT